MTEEMIDYNNILTLRNHLVTLPVGKLNELYEDKGSYITFLDTVALLSEADSAFLLFSEEFLEKILHVAQIHRFDFEQPEVKEIINEIISYINRIRTYPEAFAAQLKNGYLAYQEELREVTFHSEESFLTSMSYDAIVFTALREGKVDGIDDEYGMMSLNFLLKTCPELFQDSKVKETTLALLDRAGHNSGVLTSKKKMVKRALANFNEVSKKEE